MIFSAPFHSVITINKWSSELLHLPHWNVFFNLTNSLKFFNLEKLCTICYLALMINKKPNISLWEKQDHIYIFSFYFWHYFCRKILKEGVNEVCHRNHINFAPHCLHECSKLHFSITIKTVSLTIRLIYIRLCKYDITYKTRGFKS